MTDQYEDFKNSPVAKQLLDDFRSNSIRAKDFRNILNDNGCWLGLWRNTATPTRKLAYRLIDEHRELFSSGLIMADGNVKGRERGTGLLSELLKNGRLPRTTLIDRDKIYERTQVDVLNEKRGIKKQTVSQTVTTRGDESLLGNSNTSIEYANLLSAMTNGFSEIRHSLQSKDIADSEKFSQLQGNCEKIQVEHHTMVEVQTKHGRKITEHGREIADLRREVKTLTATLGKNQQQAIK